MQYSMDALLDVVVVGAGVEGSSTAYHLARRAWITAARAG